MCKREEKREERESEEKLKIEKIVTYQSIKIKIQIHIHTLDREFIVGNFIR